MNFNTFEFLLIFLPVTLVLFYIVPARFRLVVLLTSSLLFYGYSGLQALGAMIIAIVWAFGLVSLVARDNSRLKLTLAISMPVVILFLFKYLGFTLENFGLDIAKSAWPFSLIASIVLPAGISFYTFQLISYVFDVREGKVKIERNPLRFATYISFFPQLIAGPIVRYEAIQDQLTKIQQAQSLRPDISTGVAFLAFGLTGKVLISDVLSLLIARYSHVDYTNVGTSTDAAFLILAYSFKIYFDFWAYSLMAIGLGKLFCINLPRNFAEPYKSKNPKEFWRKWHITLSYWLRDYFYLRIGGNRRYAINILFVFAACGLWHGAGWNFIVWGLYHAFFIILYHFTRELWERAPSWFQVTITFLIVTFSWPLFFTDPAKYLTILGRLIGAYGSTGESVYDASVWFVIAIAAVVTFLMSEDRWLYTKRQTFLRSSPYLHAAMIFICILFLRFSDTFIYFRF